MEPIEHLPLPSAARSLARCVVRAVMLLIQRRIRQPTARKGWQIRFADGSTATVYRETVIGRPEPVEPALLVVVFRLRHVRGGWAHALFRAESELNTILFAGFPGLVSKLWLSHDEQRRYRGVYQWDGRQSAVAYVGALWWLLVLVAEKSSIRYEVVPDVSLDNVLNGCLHLEFPETRGSLPRWTDRRPVKRSNAQRPPAPVAEPRSA